ncbi:helix-turn-helix domain-containing protein [Enterococcus entomosocium]|uniref:helix-turn-helix domain-containing protein n=1 Tax=Enterococcus entomosocium TaxID=3034352 RepID=UPI001FD4374F|nr:helix-turn-helix domain-containing protein [Enterococcus casseliflavus]
MDSLFYQLIFHAKTKRWFQLLEIMEENEHILAQHLIDQTQAARRTVLSDIKEIKTYFGDTIQLTGDEKGYHFSFQDPIGFYQKKQALLEEEKVFLFVDQLTAGKRLKNHQWAQYLAVSQAAFGRMKRQLQPLLSQSYGVCLENKTNQLIGEEAAVRQFLYDFYFTLPLYPEILTDHIRHLHSEKLLVHQGTWRLDHQLLNQWCQLTKLRVDQGYLLPERKEQRVLQELLVQAFDQQVTVALPKPEKAALFLLALDEKQFLNPLTQKAFIQRFSADTNLYFFVRSTEGLSYHLFETLLSLMNTFFQLPVMNEASEEREEQVLLLALIDRYVAEKHKYSHTVYVTYRLTGSPALKCWIKAEVQKSFAQAGLHLIEAGIGEQLGMIRHVCITNRPIEVAHEATIELPYVPTKETIVGALTEYF